jgi:hypothetical protein
MADCLADHQAHKSIKWLSEYINLRNFCEGDRKIMDGFWPIIRTLVGRFLSELVLFGLRMSPEYCWVHGKGFAPAAALWHTAGRISVER